MKEEMEEETKRRNKGMKEEMKDEMEEEIKRRDELGKNNWRVQ